MSNPVKILLEKPWFWPGFIVGLLSLGVLANVGLMVLANTDPSFSVEPDYYQKALDWDQTMAQERQNLRLGWGATLTTAPADEGMSVVARVTDKEGAPVAPDAVSVEASHNARGGHVLTATFMQRRDGSFSADMPIRRPGMWEFRLAVQRGDEHFTQIIRQDVFVPRTLRRKAVAVPARRFRPPRPRASAGDATSKSAHKSVVELARIRRTGPRDPFSPECPRPGARAQVSGGGAGS